MRHLSSGSRVRTPLELSQITDRVRSELLDGADPASGVLIALENYWMKSIAIKVRTPTDREALARIAWQVKNADRPAPAVTATNCARLWKSRLQDAKKSRKMTDRALQSLTECQRTISRNPRPVVRGTSRLHFRANCRKGRHFRRCKSNGRPAKYQSRAAAATQAGGRIPATTLRVRRSSHPFQNRLRFQRRAAVPQVRTNRRLTIPPISTFGRYAS